MDTLTPWLPDAAVLDLFAGAGGVGLEALSRGAAQATFVERDAAAVAALRRNLAALGLEGTARVLAQDALRAIERLQGEGRAFSIIFLDPPYETDLAARALAALDAGGVAAPGAVVVAQHRSKQPLPAEFGALRAYRRRRFGETTLTFFRAGE